jgi:trk system potassium uptake protein TrkA
LEPSGRDIVLIEKDPEICEKLASELHALVICGDASDKKTLEDAKIKTADVFVAVAGNDSENIVACQLAKNSYGVPLVLARVEDIDRAQMCCSMGMWPDSQRNRFCNSGNTTKPTPEYLAKANHKSAHELL